MQITARHTNPFDFFIKSPDWRAIRPSVLWLSLAIAVTVALIAASYNLNSHFAEKNRLEALNQQFAKILVRSLSLFEYANIALLSENQLSLRDIDSVRVIDSVGYSVFEGQETGHSQFIFSPLLRQQYEYRHEISCEDGTNECGVFISYTVNSLKLIWLNTIFVSASCFIIVFMAVTKTLSTYINNYVRQPILQLNTAMLETFRTGQHVQCDHSSDTEVGMLADSFNKMQRQLQRSQSALEKAQRMEAIGTITSGVAHEFNNLLAVILGNLDMIELEDGEHKDEHLNDIRVAAQNSTMIVEKLLSYSRPPSFDKETNIQLNQLFTNVNGLIVPFMSQTQITFRIECSKDHVVPSGDLEAALVTLTKNACEAMHGTGHIIILARDAKPDEIPVSSKQFIVIEIIDDGPGIPKALQHRIFDPFFSTKEVGHGVGLGLWTVFRCMEQLGGSITYTHQNHFPPYGSCFTLVIPTVSAMGANTLNQGANIVSDSSGRLSGKSMLIIEDEPSLLSIYSAYFKKKDMHIFTAETMQAGMDIIQKGTADLDIILSDRCLPDGLGVDILRMVRNNNSKIMTVLLSGNLGTDLENHDYIDLVLQKPIKLINLERSLIVAYENFCPSEKPHDTPCDASQLCT